MKLLFILIIKLYKKTISPFLHYLGYDCKFYPTCSEYTIEAIQSYGVIKGCFKKNNKMQSILKRWI